MFTIKHNFVFTLYSIILFFALNYTLIKVYKEAQLAPKGGGDTASSRIIRKSLPDLSLPGNLKTIL